METNLPTTPIEIIDKMKEILEQGWCKEYEARTYYGAGCRVGHPEATQFCIVGALARSRNAYCVGAIDDKLTRKMMSFLNERVHWHRGWGNVTDFNDSDTTELDDVLGFLDEAKHDLKNPEIAERFELIEA